MPTFNFNPVKKESKKVKDNPHLAVVRKGDHNTYGRFAKYGNNGAVYGIKSKVTNKVYIGATKHLQRRLLKHFSELHLNRHRNKQLQTDYNKYGNDSFDIIVYCNCEDKLLYLEKLIQIAIDIEGLYNERISGYYITDEYRSKLANADKSSHKTKEFSQKMSKLKANRVGQYTFAGQLIKTWESVVSICETLGHTRSVINSVCNGSKKHAYGYIWRYIDNNDKIIYNGYLKARKKN